jgi:hypothetical protein
VCYRWFVYPKSIFALTMLASTVFCLEAYAASLRLNWSDISTNESGFKIERMAGSASYGQVATVASNIQTYTDTTVTPGSTYCYRVRAYNSAGTSAPSNAGCATAPETSTSSTGSSTGSTTTSPTTSPSEIITRLSSKWSDYRASVKMRSSDNDGIGVMFRYQDSENYYRFSWNLHHKYRRLEKQVGGVFKVLAQDSVTYKPGQTYALRIVAQGPSLKVQIDGKTIFSVTDTSFSEGTIALYSHYNQGSSFDDVLVEDLITGKVLLSENFNDSDHVGWTIIDEGNVDGPSKWSAATGALVQRSNIGSADPHDLGTYALFTRGSWQDYRVALKMRSADNDPIGVLFRFQDNDNYYRLSWDKQTAGRRLIKRKNGVFEILAQDSVPYIPGKNYHVEIIAQGGSLKVNIDGKFAFSVTDQSFKVGAVALYSSHNQGSVFDDVLVEELPTKAVLLWDDFNDGKLAGWTIFDEAGAKSGPSAWSILKGELIQTSNIGTDATGVGTFALY